MDSRIVAVVGARQVGKTTLARQVADAWGRAPVNHFDLEDPVDLVRLDQPSLVLRPLRGLVILDEIHRLPDLFPLLRVLADRPRPATRFLVLGSASPELLRQTSETLAGRIQFVELDPLDLEEVGAGRLDRLWVRGGFPRAFLARSDRASLEWRRGFSRTFLERDLPSLGVRIPAITLHRFWNMLAHYHGGIWNAAEFARSFGTGEGTVRRYLDLLTATFVVRQLPPWFANIGKRQVKSPKVYIADAGLLHSFLDIESMKQLLVHPRLGASWEGFALQQVMRRLGARPQECYYWATHTGAELDLLWVRGRQRWGFEFKRTDQPKRTRSMLSALGDLELSRLYVVHAGDHAFPMDRRIQAIPLSRLQHEIPRPR